MVSKFRANFKINHKTTGVEAYLEEGREITEDKEGPIRIGDLKTRKIDNGNQQKISTKPRTDKNTHMRNLSRNLFKNI